MNYDNIVEEINSAKMKFAYPNRMSDPEVEHQLCRIGELLEQKNALTGGDDDIKYLYSDDNECLWFVAGFVGEDTGTTDSQSTPLCVGDTIEYSNGRRMVINGASGKPVFSQEYIDRKQAVKVCSYDQLQLQDAQSAASSVTLKSCTLQYQRQQDREQQNGMGISFGGM